jgi:23S rRNA pseudouridine2605 synthase
VSTAQTVKLRVDRLLVSRGLGNRREIQKWIRRGKVSYEGSQITNPSTHLPIDVTLLVNGELCDPIPKLIAYHKPLGQLSTLRDPWGRSGLDYVLPIQWRSSVHPVGRLDADTSGLLLFSSDGALTQYLLHPKRCMSRRYRAIVNHLPDDLKQNLIDGVETSLGCFAAVLERIEPFETDRHADYTTTDHELDEARGVIWLSVTEGKHRMVRRMLHNAGASVLALHRAQYGSVELGELSEGEYRVVSDLELSELCG